MFISRVITRREGKNPRFRGRSIVWRVYKPTQVWGKQQTKKLKFQREVEKKIVIVEGRFPRKMVRSSSEAKAPRTKATTSQQGKQTGVKREKTLDQRVAHRVSCRKSRARIKNRKNQMEEENKRMKKQLEEQKSELLRFQNEMQKYKRAVEEQRAMEAQMRQFPTSLEIEGQSISSFEQMSDFFTSQKYEPNHLGLDNTNITASDRRPSFVANNIGFDAPNNNNLSSCDPTAGVLDSGAACLRENYVDSIKEFEFEPYAGFFDLSACFSFHANDDDNLFPWIKETSKPDATAGISETKNLVVENQNNELVNQIDHNALSDYSSCNPAAGVLVSGAGSSFHANDGDLNSDRVGKMSKPDTAADISRTENLVVENQNNEPVNQIDHNAMVQRRELSPAQRSAENERDRQHMSEYKIKPELKRLKNVVVKYEEMVPLFNTISQLAEESKQMNNTEPNLARRIQEVDNIFRQHIQEMPNKSFDHGSESSHTAMYTAEFVQDFIEKLDVKEKSKVDFPDFEGLVEEMEKSGRRNLPPSLVPIDKILKKDYGDITAESNQITPVIRDSYILFCSVIKEMDQLQLEQLDPEKMFLWRDAINSGLNMGFKGGFAIEHLKKIARAYFDSKELESMKERMSKLKTDLHNAEMQSSEMCTNGLHDFQGKPVSTGLLNFVTK